MSLKYETVESIQKTYSFMRLSELREEYETYNKKVQENSNNFSNEMNNKGIALNKQLKKISVETDYDMVKRLVKLKQLMKEKSEELKKCTLEGKNKKKQLRLQVEYDDVFEMYLDAEESMIDIERGLYMGLALDFENMNSFIPLYAKWSNLNNHAIFTGTTRVGKTKLLLSHSRQIIHRPDADLVIFDPKGGEGQEALSSIVEFASEAKREHNFFYFSPSHVELSVPMNIIYNMNNESIASMVKMMAMGDSPDGEFFANIAYRTTMGILLAFEFLEKNSDPTGASAKRKEREEYIRFVQLLDLRGQEVESIDELNRIIIPDIIERITKSLNLESRELEEIRKGSDTLVFSRSLISFKELAAYSSFSELSKLKALVEDTTLANEKEHGIDVISEIEEIRQQALQILNDIVGVGDAHYMKLAASLSIVLTQFATGPVGKLFCSTRINPWMIEMYGTNDRNGLIAFIQPSPMKFQAVSDMVSKAILMMLYTLYGEVGSSGRGMDRRLFIQIDEAKSMLFSGIEDSANKLGGIGASMFFYTQSYADIEDKLGVTKAKVLLDNLNTVEFMKMNDRESAKNASESLGTTIKREHMFIGDDHGGGRMMVQKKDEDLIAPSSFRKLPVARGIVVHDGRVYLVDNPFQPDPYGELEMPESEAEMNLKELIKINEKLSLAQVQIDGLEKEMS